MAGNVIEFAPNRDTQDGLSTSDKSGCDLTAIETLELVRTFSRIKDPSRRQDAIEYLRKIGGE